MYEGYFFVFENLSRFEVIFVIFKISIDCSNMLSFEFSLLYECRSSEFFAVIFKIFISVVEKRFGFVS